MYAYGYYSKSDPTKEYYCVWPSSSLTEARDYFSKIKQLSLDEFNKLYEVERYKV